MTEPPWKHMYALGYYEFTLKDFINLLCARIGTYKTDFSKLTLTKANWPSVGL